MLTGPATGHKPSPRGRSRCSRGSAPTPSRLDRSAPWRVQFHVPVHDPDAGALATTRDAIAPVLAAALATPGPVPPLEVETYTWSVLPPERRPTDDAGLIEGIARELAWTRDLLMSLGAGAKP